jgi:uncharacterized membrane protein YvlD (DUF360 family)
LYNHRLYLLYWLVNSVTIYLFSFLFSGQIVLGNYKFTSIEAAIYAGFWITVFLWAMWDFVYARGVKMSSELSNIIFFWAINTVALWIVSRLSHILGFGMASFLWAFILGIIITLTQRLVWRTIVDRRSRSA